MFDVFILRFIILLLKIILKVFIVVFGFFSKIVFRYVSIRFKVYSVFVIDDFWEFVIF